MHGDGSRRRILRVIAGGATQILVLNPPAPESSNYPRRAGAPDENETFRYVAEHLQRLGVRVPRIDAFDKSEGIPADAISANGNRGQYVIIVPSRNIVIVRRGEDPTGKRFDHVAFTRDVLAALD